MARFGHCRACDGHIHTWMMACFLDTVDEGRQTWTFAVFSLEKRKKQNATRGKSRPGAGEVALSQGRARPQNAEGTAPNLELAGLTGDPNKAVTPDRKDVTQPPGNILCDQRVPPAPFPPNSIPRVDHMGRGEKVCRGEGGGGGGGLRRPISEPQMGLQGMGWGGGWGSGVPQHLYLQMIATRR